MALVAIVASFLAGCSGSSTVKPKPAAAPPSQQVLTVASVVVGPTEDIQTLDPALITLGTDTSMAEQVFPTLLVLHYDPSTSSGMTLVPWAATTVPKPSPDGLTMTFHLRPGMTWTDGTPIDANDFAYSINRALDPCTAKLFNTLLPGPFMLQWIKGAGPFASGTCTNLTTLDPHAGQGLIGTSILATDALTLQVRLAAPYAWAVWSLVTTPAMAVPRSLIARYGSQHWTDHLADGKGFGGNAFKVTAWDHLGHMTLSANPTFWGSPKPTLQRLQISFKTSRAAAYKAYLDGRVMVAYGLPQEDYASASRRSDLHTFPELSIGSIDLNWSKPPFNNRLARQAFDLALNKVELNKAMNSGTAFATNHMIPLGESDYNPHLVGPDGTQSLTGNFAQALQDWQQYAAANCPGGQAANCPTITAAAPNDDDFTLKLAKLEQEQWQRALGINVNLDAMPSGQYYSLILAPNPQQKPQAWNIGYLVDFPVGWDWTTLQASPGSPANLNGINDLAANALMASADSDQNPFQQAEDYQAAEQQLVRDVAWISLNQAVGFWSSTSKVNGFTYSPVNYWLPGNMLQTYITA
jgi:peptide/nickel transport system substrate-binding protein/oligopeptide transport system substrate-binding protein